MIHQLRCIYNQKYTKEVAKAKLGLWYNEMGELEKRLKGSYFNTVINTIRSYSEEILNYYNNRSTNASAESFNAKIKAFRAGFRGVTDVKFFLYRLAKIYA
ncbi:MAG: transposase [Bacteroidales bacterium]